MPLPRLPALGAALVLGLLPVIASAAAPLRIMPLGDSITRGSYLAHHDAGPFKDQPFGLPNPAGGGWRKGLQDRLRAAHVACDFVGDLDYYAFGRDGRVDPDFDPDHHGLAGFSNRRILTGGVVPTPKDVLAARGVTEIQVPPLGDVLARQRPDVILLMSGANGFDAPARDELVRFIVTQAPSVRLFVGTILPQRPPRAGWEQVDAYNASLPAFVAALQAEGRHVTLVDLHGAVSADDLLSDGVHPNAEGLRKIADAWFAALKAAGCLGP